MRVASARRWALGALSAPQPATNNGLPCPWKCAWSMRSPSDGQTPLSSLPHPGRCNASNQADSRGGRIKTVLHPPYLSNAARRSSHLLRASKAAVEQLTFLSTRRQELLEAARHRLSLCPIMLGLAEHHRTKRCCALAKAGVPKACRCFDLTTAARQLRRPAAVAGGSSHPVEAVTGAGAHARGVPAKLGHARRKSGLKRADIPPAPARPARASRRAAFRSHFRKK